MCLNDIPSADGGHSHTQYVDEHEFNEMKEEFDNKTAELEVKILALEAKGSYQQYLFFLSYNGFIPLLQVYHKYILNSPLFI